MLYAVHDAARWHARFRLEKRWGDWSAADVAAGRAWDPYEVLEDADNMLVYGGSSALWEQLLATGAITAYNAANAHVGVGDGTTSAVATQTDLQGTNKARRPMDPGWPAHTDGITASAASIEFQSTFPASVGNFAWKETGVFNASAGGRMLNRKLLNTAWGTKSSGQTWTLKITITLA